MAMASSLADENHELPQDSLRDFDATLNHRRQNTCLQALCRLFSFSQEA